MYSFLFCGFRELNELVSPLRPKFPISSCDHLLLVLNGAQYPGEERQEFLWRVEARGLAGNDMLDPTREALRRGSHFHPELHDKRPMGREERLLWRPTRLALRCAA